MATRKQLFSATPAKMSEEPIALQLVRQLPDGSGYELCREAVDKLKNMGDGPIAVVSIAGVARSGKSRILNRLLQVLMDTEGSASEEQTSQSNAVVMAMAAVASSLLIYNHLGCMRENMVDDLSLTARTFKDLSNTSGDAVGSPICQPPDLLMLIRDAHRLVSESTPNDLLESSLAECPSAGTDVRQITERNATRLLIKDVFINRNCCLLPRPALEIINLEDLAVSTLNPQFVEGVNQLRSTIWSTTSPKTFKGKTLTGPLLVELLTAAITTANNSGGVLNVGAMWSAIIATVDAELAVSHAAEAVAEPKAPAAEIAGDDGLALEAMPCRAHTDARPFEHVKAQSGGSGSLLAEHHKAKLADILEELVAESLVPDDRLSDLKEEVLKLCDSLMDTNITHAKDSNVDDNRVTLFAAAQQAVDWFKADTSTAINRQCTTDYNYASRVCEVAADRAHRMFCELASAKAGLLPGSKAYRTAQGVLDTNISTWQTELLADVCENMAIKEKKEQARKVAEARAEIQRERLERQRRREQAGYLVIEGRLAEAEDMGWQQSHNSATAASTASSGQGAALYSSDSLFGRFYAHFEREIDERSQRISTTSRGQLCRFCLTGRDCYLHRDL